MVELPPDRVGVTLWSILAGAAAGAAVIAVVLMTWRLTSATLLSPNALMAILGGGLLGAIVTGWHLTRPLREPWRRGVTTATGAFGTVLLGLGTVIVDLMGQALGLAVYAAVLGLIAALAVRRARRAGLERHIET